MENKVYRAIFKTAGKTVDQLVFDFGSDSLDAEKIDSWSKAYDAIDGIEVAVMKSPVFSGYILTAWKDEDESKIREFIYQTEQEDGLYHDDWEQFLLDWECYEYEPSGVFTFKDDELQILEVLTGWGML